MKVLLFKELESGELEPPQAPLSKFWVGESSGIMPRWLPYQAPTKKDLENLLCGEMGFCTEDSKFYYKTRDGVMLQTESFTIG